MICPTASMALAGGANSVCIIITECEIRNEAQRSADSALDKDFQRRRTEK